jgi:glycosyltransferase involved in cell wall biosynthesis
MDTPEISVVIPAYNAATWIGETLGSVLAQTYPKRHLEIVVVDDGSADETSAIAETKLAGSGIAHTLLRNLEPKGPGAARNRGWQRARGAWIQFLDADDILDPEKIEIQAHGGQHVPSSVAVLFSAWGSLVCAGGRWEAKTPGVVPRVGADPLMDVLRPNNFIATGSQLFRRAWLERIGGYAETCGLVEDVDLLMRLIRRGGVLRRVPSTRPLFWYRRRDGSLSRASARAFHEGCVRNAEAAEAYWRAQGRVSDAQARLLAEIYSGAAQFFADHDVALFDRLVRRIEDLCPSFVPLGPSGLKRLTQLLGYRRAERVAVQYRHLKRLVNGS